MHSIIIHMLTYCIPLSLQYSQHAQAKCKRHQYETFTHNMVISTILKATPNIQSKLRYHRTTLNHSAASDSRNVTLSRYHNPQQKSKEILDDVLRPLLYCNDENERDRTLSEKLRITQARCQQLSYRFKMTQQSQ